MSVRHIGPQNQPHNGVSIYAGIVDECLREIPAPSADIVHFELGYSGNDELWAAYAAARRHAKLVVTLHDPPVVTGKPFGRFFPGGGVGTKAVRKLLDLTAGRWVVRRVVRGAGAVLVLNRLAKPVVARRFGIAPEKVYVSPLPPFVSASGTAAPVRGHDGLKLLFFGNISPRKGVDLLIAAFCQAFAQDAGCRLTVVGGHTGEEAFQRTLEQMRNSLPNRERITFTGFLPDDKLAGEIAAADVVALPYLDPGIIHASAPLITAMACGKAVVASRIPVFEGEIAEGENGLLFRAGDTNDLVAKLQRLRGDNALVRRLGEAAARHIREENSLARIREDLSKVYSSL